MKFDSQILEILLKKTDLKFRSMPYIHGGLTALAIAPDFIDWDIIVGAPGMILFDLKPNEIDELDMEDMTLDDVFEYVDKIESGILDDIDNECYEPFFDKQGNGVRGLKNYQEWCKGFLSMAMVVNVMPEESVEPNQTVLAFASILMSSGINDKLPKGIEPVIKEIEKDPVGYFAGCVYAINDFWGTKEEEYENEELIHEDEGDDSFSGTVVRDNPKIQRNDPCPCGSGKKYKKCCGMESASANLDIFSTVNESKGDNILQFPIVKTGKNVKKKCFICGKTKNLVKTPCCNKWICDDEDQYVLFSYSRNSCYRNHDRFTLCGYHYAGRHEGDWKECPVCREELSHEVEMYVWYGTNEYNDEKLPDPPAFKPTLCAKCKKRIVLPEGGFTMSKGEYVCGKCDPVVIPDFR